jgi:hypothetical protein
MEFATQLREAMGPMSQEELEAKSGVAQATISRHLRGGGVTMATIKRYETALPGLIEIRLRDSKAHRGQDIKRRGLASDSSKAVA